MRGSSVATAALTVALLAACADALPPSPGAAGPGVAITIAPLTLPGVTRAVYTLTVENGDHQVVVQRSLDSLTYGASNGGLSYVAPCDAASNDNALILTVDALYSGAGANALIAADTWVNPGAVRRTVTCAPNADVAVTFDLTVLRAAEQGFFDIALEFSDVFCSAKLECDNTHAFPGFATATTVVLAFVCTAGPDADTTLYLNDLAVECDLGTATLDPDAGPGKLDLDTGVSGSAGIIAAASVYRGQEELAGNARYWNVAFALVDDVTGCALRTRGTASQGPLPGRATAADAVYPYVDWLVPLTDAQGVTTCGAHPLGGLGTAGGVSLGYTTTGPETFAHEHPVAPPAAPDLTAGLVAYWPADQDSLDAIGTTDATAVGTVTFTPSPWCNAWNFPASPVTYLTLGNPPALGLTSQMTVSAWVRFVAPGPATASTAFISILSNWDNYTLGTAGYALGLNPTDATHFHPGFSLTSSGSDIHGAGTTTDLVAGQWTHLVATYDGAAIVLYVDGAAVATTPYVGTIFDPAGVSMEINAIVRLDGTLHSMVGQIDELKVWEVGLDAAAVTALHNAEVGGRACP